jgi:hypothetical protein
MREITRREFKTMFKIISIFLAVEHLYERKYRVVVIMKNVFIELYKNYSLSSFSIINCVSSGSSILIRKKGSASSERFID